MTIEAIEDTVEPNVAELLERIAYLEKLAYLDDLTGLPNRRHFDENAQDHIAEFAAVFIMDLNDFKARNDTHGHDAGDEYLRTIGRKLRRLPGLCCRLGGDEFCGILPPGSLVHLDELLASIGHQHASIGVCLMGPGMTLRVAKKKADDAMYRAKARRAKLPEVVL